MSPKTRWFWSLAATVLVGDVVSKRLAEQALQPMHVPHEIVGDVLRFTLTYNRGAAFSMSLGEYSRWGFAVMATIVLVVLLRSLASTPAGDRWQGAAIGLVSGGALGNLIDRLRHPNGVVDFIDIGLGDVRFWIFNVADMGVTFGAIMLIIAMLKTPAQAPPTESVL
ncbi:MAG: signal peptidase II [Gemmatimonadetes bacterium]|nr:signal peptidase II [Gemmatimonadota bacterium]HNV76368.1 signal peptidase II [Gemmatimonadaceae bacterium]MBK6454914.1 signal peptidase II [Gemmatimonadota bacterium]MBK6841101.1 signal peptidase II [Gemmatimonadota bacterium]MBK7834786.1 signal peptidase II [Gemmatimonadota bacterium]